MAKRKPDDMVGLQVRFTEAMRAAIEREAKRNHRSLNGEIVHRLAVTLGDEGVALEQQFGEVQREVSKALHELVQQIVGERRANRGAAEAPTKPLRRPK